MAKIRIGLNWGNAPMGVSPDHGYQSFLWLAINRPALNGRRSQRGGGLLFYRQASRGNLMRTLTNDYYNCKLSNLGYTSK